MARSIMVALDGTEKDGRAVAAASALARLSESDLHFVRVVIDPLVGVTRDPRDEFVGLRAAEELLAAVVSERSVAQHQLASVTQGLGMPAGRVATTAVIQAADVAAALVTHALERDALLVVLATRAPGARSRAIAGSVADHVMRECPRPVVLVPPGAAFLAGKTPAIARVLVPLDDSSLSFRSVEFVLGLPRAVDLEYVLLEVVAEEAARVEAEERLAKTAAWMRSRGVRSVAVRIVHAPDAAAAIVGAVREELVDGIVMSTRGAGGLGRLILGSVAEHVVRASELPVMLLTPRVLSQR